MQTVKKILASLLVFCLFVGGGELLSRFIIHFYNPELPIEISAIVSAGKYLRQAVVKKGYGLINSDYIADLGNYINSESELENRLNDFSINGIGLANTPYEQLISDRIRTITKDADGHLENQSNKVRYTRLLRSRVFNPWDPIIFNSGVEYETDPVIQQFIEKYALEAKLQSLDKDGFRTTVPLVRSEKIILVLGDSVAFGASLADNETLASQLQQHYQNVRFINDSIGGGKASDNRYRLKKRLDHYGENIIGVIYVHTENDVTSTDTPKVIVEKLNEILMASNVEYKAFVHQVYIYQSMPDLLRGKYLVKFGNTNKWKGRDEKELFKFFKLKKDTLDIAKANRFHTVDFSEIVNNYRKEKGTPFAGFSLYVDHAHFSVEGTALVAGELRKSLDSFIRLRDSN
jgi:hypothetical protein